MYSSILCFQDLPSLVAWCSAQSVDLVVEVKTAGEHNGWSRDRASQQPAEAGNPSTSAPTKLEYCTVLVLTRFLNISAQIVLIDIIFVIIHILLLHWTTDDSTESQYTILYTLHFTRWSGGLYWNFNIQLSGYDFVHRKAWNIHEARLSLWGICLSQQFKSFISDNIALNNIFIVKRMWKKRYLTYNQDDDKVDKVQNPTAEPAMKVWYFWSL